MSRGPLAGLRIVEFSAFVAAPLAFSASGTPDPLPAPTLGADTASVLQSLAAPNKD